MKFWNATVIDKTNKTLYFGVAAPKSYNASRVKKILFKIHPEYLSIKFKRTQRPKNWAVFER